MPRRQQDAENWSRAQVMLTKPDFLPAAVKLIGPAAGGAKPDTETLYRFKNLKPNRPAIATVWRGDVFKPSLKGYTVVRGGGAGGNPAGGRAGAAPVVRHIVPAVIGMPYKMAGKVMQGRGYEPKFVIGPATDRGTLVGKVAAQTVKGGTELKAGSRVEIQVYVAAVEKAGATKAAAAGP